MLAIEPANVKALMRRALAHVTPPAPPHRSMIYWDSSDRYRVWLQTQQHENERSVADYTAALLQTPSHLTPVELPSWVPLARVRRALALESLNRMDSLETALSDLDLARGCVLPPDLLVKMSHLH